MRKFHPRLIVLIFIMGISCAKKNPEIISYTIDPAKTTIEFYWKNDQGIPLESLGNLRKYLDSKHKTLLFAMNGGMYDAQNNPVGLYIEHGKTLKKLNTHQVKPDKNGVVPNFHIQPNGVFYITAQHQAGISTTKDFPSNDNVEFATQSGPMLVIDSSINKIFQRGSSNRQIRNGVGILPDNQIILAMSRDKINFYDFAAFFQSRGCRQALFLDGVISRTYFPEKDLTDNGGDFGVMIGVIK